MMKKEIRKQLIHQRMNLLNETKHSFDQIILKKLVQFINIHKYKHIMIFYPMKYEIQLLPLLDSLPNCSFYLPKVINQNEMKLTCWDNEMIKHPFGMFETKNSYYITPNQVDIIIFPGLGFDRFGHRIGYGKGYYDQFIHKNKLYQKIKIGICYQLQLLSHIPVESHDIFMDIIFTEKSEYYIKK